MFHIIHICFILYICVYFELITFGIYIYIYIFFELIFCHASVEILMKLLFLSGCDFYNWFVSLEFVKNLILYIYKFWYDIKNQYISREILIFILTKCLLYLKYYEFWFMLSVIYTYYVYVYRNYIINVRYKTNMITNELIQNEKLLHL